MRTVAAVAVFALLLGALIQVRASHPPIRVEYFVTPEFPALARQAVIGGEVKLRLSVQADGSVSNVDIDAAKHPLLAESAKAALSKWRFEAAQSKSTAMVTVRYAFTDRVRECPSAHSVTVDLRTGLVTLLVDRPRTIHSDT